MTLPVYPAQISLVSYRADGSFVCGGTVGSLNGYTYHYFYNSGSYTA